MLNKTLILIEKKEKKQTKIQPTRKIANTIIGIRNLSSVIECKWPQISN